MAVHCFPAELGHELRRPSLPEAVEPLAGRLARPVESPPEATPVRRHERGNRVSGPPAAAGR